MVKLRNNSELMNKKLIFSDPFKSSFEDLELRKSKTVSDLTKVDISSVVVGCLRHLEGSHSKLFIENNTDFNILEEKIAKAGKI